MDRAKLDEILEKHKKWLNGEDGGEKADLSGADLSRAYLSGADLDYSAWPLWCGSLDAHIDDRIARQLLYHLMRPCLVSPDVSEDFKRALFTPELIAEANAFHRVDECGWIESPYEEDDHGQSN